MKSSPFIILLFSVTSLLSQNALNFDGIDDHITTPAGGPIGPGDRTVECWIRTSNSQQTQQVIFDYGAMSPLGSRFTLNLINFGLLRIEVGGNGFNSTQSIADGQWHHVAVTYDNSAANKFSMYIDGQLEASQNTTVPVNTSGTGLFIGRRNDGVNYFTGDVDELRVWNLVRSQTEIDSSRNVEFCAIPPGLIMYFNFNQGIAGGNNSAVTTLTNQVGANNGTLNNFALSGNNSNWISGTSLSRGIVTGTDSVTGCGSLISPSGKYVWTVSGLYQDTLTTTWGCDSVIDINVRIINLDTSVTRLLSALSSNATGVNYQWLNCDSNYSIIPGATSQLFIPTTIGNYAVKIDSGGCVDTSACYLVDNFNVDERRSEILLKIFPNPMYKGQELNYSCSAPGIHSWELFSLSGYPIDRGEISGSHGKLGIFSSLEPGCYILKVIMEGQPVIRQVIVGAGG